MPEQCELACDFWPLRASAPHRRTAFAPKELARLFGQMHTAGKVDGLFLSSGIAGPPDATMERMLAAVEIPRRREGFDRHVPPQPPPGASGAAGQAAPRPARPPPLNPPGAHGTHPGPPP